MKNADIEHRYEKLVWLATISGRKLLIEQLKLKKAIMKKGFKLSLPGHGDDESHLFKSSDLISTVDIYPELFTESLAYVWLPPAGVE